MMESRIICILADHIVFKDQSVNGFCKKNGAVKGFKIVVFNHHSFFSFSPFYGYFSGKEALFAALVEEHATAIMNIFMSAQEDFEMLDEKDKANHMGVESRKSIDAILDYVYEHFDEFKLIICKSEGTCYENFVHNMVEIEVAETFEFIKSLKKQGYDVPDMEKAVCHMIASGMFTGIFELIEHDMKKKMQKICVCIFGFLHRRLVENFRDLKALLIFI